ncbi:transient receptor potential cation channel subfamily A member 1-like, partial [Clarias magur]
ITYNFQWLQVPVNVQKSSQTDKNLYIQPLSALNAMVQYNRLELLTHPVCQKYLEMKWFDRFGIYVVMFGEIIKTLLSVIVLFFFLLLAYGLSFHALMLHRDEFNSVPLSLAQTFVMTVGELNYDTSFLEAYNQGHLAFPGITYYIFVTFVLFMPILLMNLMIGLAVGDIAEVQRNAALKRIAMQINLHTTLEEKLPYWFMKRVDKPSVTFYPNRKCAKFQGMMEKIFGNISPENEVRTRLNTQVKKSGPLEAEMMKQKY